MDIRSADTSSLAAKRTEFDKIAPVTQKLKGFTEERLAAHEGAEANGQNIRRPKTIRNNQENKDGHFDSLDYEEEENSSEENDGDSETSAGCTEHHLLDVKV